MSQQSKVVRVRKKIRRSFSEQFFHVLIGIFIVGLCVTIIVPILYVFTLSFSGSTAAAAGFSIFPKEWTLNSYRQILSSPPVIFGFQNTLFRTILGTCLSLSLMPAAAYALSKKEMPFNKAITIFFVVTMFFNGGLIPTFLLIDSIGLIDSRLVLVLPVVFNTWYMLIIRNFLIGGVSASLEEAAHIDGANDYQILFRIIYPISQPVLATVGLWIAVMHWNSYFDSLIYIRDPLKQVLQVQLRRVVLEANNLAMQQIMRDVNVAAGKYSTETIKAAMTMVTMLPIVMVYPFVQKYFVKGIMVGAVKG